MKIRLVSITFISIGIFMIFFGGIYQLYLFNEEKALLATKNIILTDYELFKIKYEKFYNTRREIYEEVIDQHKIDEMDEYYDEMIKKLDEYTEVVLEVEEVSKNLKEETPKIKSDITDDDLKSKSEAFLVNYQQMLDYFSEDIKKFNEEIRAYNTLSKSKNHQLTEYEPNLEDNANA